MENLILITNDDGQDSKGLRFLIDIMKDYGKVVAISTKDHMSGMSMAITTQIPIRLTKIEESEGYVLYAINGTPTDCVKFALDKLVDRLPDLIVSGINHGSNTSVNVLYSGTMATVIEGCLDGINSIGFSLDNYSANADFSACEPYIRQITETVLNNGLPEGVCLNVNFPSIEAQYLKGIKVCRQAVGHWDEGFLLNRDPLGRDYYWLSGHYVNHEPNSTDTDEWAINNGYVSVVPIQTDMTAFNYLGELKEQLR